MKYGWFVVILMFIPLAFSYSVGMRIIPRSEPNLLDLLWIQMFDQKYLEVKQGDRLDLTMYIWLPSEKEAGGYYTMIRKCADLDKIRFACSIYDADTKETVASGLFSKCYETSARSGFYPFTTLISRKGYLKIDDDTYANICWDEDLFPGYPGKPYYGCGKWEGYGTAVFKVVKNPFRYKKEICIGDKFAIQTTYGTVFYVDPNVFEEGHRYWIRCDISNVEDIYGRGYITVYSPFLKVYSPSEYEKKKEQEERDKKIKDEIDETGKEEYRDECYDMWKSGEYKSSPLWCENCGLAHCYDGVKNCGENSTDIGGGCGGGGKSGSEEAVDTVKDNVDLILIGLLIGGAVLLLRE